MKVEDIIDIATSRHGIVRALMINFRGESPAIR